MCVNKSLPGLHHPNMQLHDCLGETSDGAPIIRSSARWFTGNSTNFAQVLLAAQQHDDAVDAGRSGFTPAQSRAAWRAAARSRSQ